MQLIFGLKPLQNIINRAFISHNKPHCLIQVDIILELDLGINLLLCKLLEIVLLGNLLPLGQLSLLLFILASIALLIFIIFFSFDHGWLTQVIIYSDLIV